MVETTKPMTIENSSLESRVDRVEVALANLTTNVDKLADHMETIVDKIEDAQKPQWTTLSAYIGILLVIAGLGWSSFDRQEEQMLQQAERIAHLDDEVETARCHLASLKTYATLQHERECPVCENGVDN